MQSIMYWINCSCNHYYAPLSMSVPFNLYGCLSPPVALLAVYLPASLFSAFSLVQFYPFDIRRVISSHVDPSLVRLLFQFPSIDGVAEWIVRLKEKMDRLMMYYLKSFPSEVVWSHILERCLLFLLAT